LDQVMREGEKHTQREEKIHLATKKHYNFIRTDQKSGDNQSWNTGMGERKQKDSRGVGETGHNNEREKKKKIITHPSQSHDFDVQTKKE